MKITHICGFQLNFVINAGHSDLTHATHGEVVGVGCDECLVWISKKGWTRENICFNENRLQCASSQSSYQVSQGCGRSSSGRRCGSLFHQKAGMSLLTSPADLQILFINHSLANSQFQSFACTMSIITYMSQYQHLPVCQLRRNGFWWIYPVWIKGFLYCPSTLAICNKTSLMCRHCSILTKREELSFLIVLALP